MLLGGRLANEWAKYRFGVFEEQGYKENQRYPLAYFENQQFLPTGCSNTEKLGDFQNR